MFASRFQSCLPAPEAFGCLSDCLRLLLFSRALPSCIAMAAPEGNRRHLEPVGSPRPRKWRRVDRAWPSSAMHAPASSCTNERARADRPVPDIGQDTRVVKRRWAALPPWQSPSDQSTFGLRGMVLMLLVRVTCVRVRLSRSRVPCGFPTTPVGLAPWVPRARAFPRLLV